MHTCWRWTQLACGYSTLITVLSLVIQNLANTNINMDRDWLNAFVAASPLCTARFGGMMHMWMQLDHILHDILLEEEAQPISSTAYKHPRINKLFNPQAKKTTGFSHGQLVRLYWSFDLEGYLVSIGKTHLPLYTSGFN